jgi:hypothetical protein
MWIGNLSWGMNEDDVDYWGAFDIGFRELLEHGGQSSMVSHIVLHGMDGAQGRRLQVFDSC